MLRMIKEFFDKHVLKISKNYYWCKHLFTASALLTIFIGGWLAYDYMASRQHTYNLVKTNYRNQIAHRIEKQHELGTAGYEGAKIIVGAINILTGIQASIYQSDGTRLYPYDCVICPTFVDEYHINRMRDKYFYINTGIGIMQKYSDDFYIAWSMSAPGIEPKVFPPSSHHWYILVIMIILAMRDVFTAVIFKNYWRFYNLHKASVKKYKTTVKKDKEEE